MLLCLCYIRQSKANKVKNRNDYWHLIVLFLNVLVAIVVFGEWLQPLRSWVLFIFLLFGPGLSLTFIIPSKDFTTQLFLIVVMSVGIDTVVAELFLYMHMWSPLLILAILMVICLTGSMFEFLIKLRRINF